MRRLTVLLTVLGMVFSMAVPALADGPGERLARAELSGSNEVPSVETDAAGEARLVLYRDHVDFKLIVSGIEDVTQAHIHLGPAGENGPVVAFLFGFAEGGVDVDGILARGTITAEDLVGPLAGQPLSALLDAIAAGNAYVNVHTVSNPAGEIRGQVG